MEKLYIAPTRNSPEISFSPVDNTFLIRGTSAPEDVRELYYPVINWFKKYTDYLLSGKAPANGKNPVRFMIDLKYFNSSSAKFIYDLLNEVKRLADAGIKVKTEWYYEEDDHDLMDAGYDISEIAGFSFEFIAKKPL